MEELFDLDSIIVTSCDCSSSGHVVSCCCDNTKPSKKRKVAGAKDTPTSLYWYEETENFVPKKADDGRVQELAQKIIEEYLRATSAETELDNKITSSITEVDKNLETIEDVITDVTAKVDENSSKIEDIEQDLSEERIKRENADRCIHKELHEFEHSMKHETKELHDLIEKEHINRHKADKELASMLSRFMDDEIDTLKDNIQLKQDSIDENKYRLFVGNEIHGEFSVNNGDKLTSVDFNPENNSLLFTIIDGYGETKTITTDLSELKTVYTASNGIEINDNNEIGIKLNEKNRFLKFRKDNELDFGLSVINGGEIKGASKDAMWQYYLCGMDGTIDSADKTTIDLTPIKEYIDNLLEAGDNIKLIRDEETSKIKVSVKIDNDIHVDNENLLYAEDGLPIEGETLDEAMKKVYKNIVRNADTSDGESIDFDSNEITF